MLEQTFVRNFVMNHSSKQIYFINDMLHNDTQIVVPDGTQLVVFDQSYNTNFTSTQFELLKNKIVNIDYIIITSNYYYFKNKHPNIVYFPFYYFYLLNNYDVLKRYNIESLRPHKLMCLNLNPWYYRTVNFLEMSRRYWFQDSKISFHWTYNKENFDTSNIGNDTLAVLTTDQKTHLAKFTFPIIVEEDWELNGSYYVGNCSRLYQDTYINYITESLTNYSFDPYINKFQEYITEKVWKAMFSGQFFYILGTPKIVEHLRDLGIDVYDDIINHSYDNEPDGVKRIQLILDDLDRLLDLNLDKVWLDTHERRKRNLDLVYSQEFQDFLTSELIRRIS